MKSIDCFSHELNELFSELNNAASVVITYTIPEAVPPDPDRVLPRLVAVNGTASFKAYAALVLHQTTTLMNGLIATVADLEMSDKRLFLQQAIRMAKRLTAFTVPPDHAPAGLNSPVIFARYRFMFDNTPVNPPDEVLRRLLYQCRRHAWYWQLTSEELVRTLFCFLTQVEFWPALFTNAGPEPARDRIPVKASVQTLAAFGRLFYEYKVFDMNNKEKFCRLLAASFCTVRQKKISAGSLKNHFDAPTPETLDYLFAEMGKMLKNSRRLYRGN